MRYANPAVQADWERWQAKVNRALSTPEQAGWRRFWDGWVICPPCMAGPGFSGGPYTPETWRVPATYDTPIKATDRCSRCRRTPPEVLIPAFQVQAVMEIFSRG